MSDLVNCDDILWLVHVPCSTDHDDVGGEDSRKQNFMRVAAFCVTRKTESSVNTAGAMPLSSIPTSEDEGAQWYVPTREANVPKNKRGKTAAASWVASETMSFQRVLKLEHLLRMENPAVVAAWKIAKKWRHNQRLLKLDGVLVQQQLDDNIRECLKKNLKAIEGAFLDEGETDKNYHGVEDEAGDENCDEEDFLRKTLSLCERFKGEGIVFGTQLAREQLKATRRRMLGHAELTADARTVFAFLGALLDPTTAQKKTTKYTIPHIIAEFAVNALRSSASITKNLLCCAAGPPRPRSPRNASTSSLHATAVFFTRLLFDISVHLPPLEYSSNGAPNQRAQPNTNNSSLRKLCDTLSTLYTSILVQTVDTALAIPLPQTLAGVSAHLPIQYLSSHPENSFCPLGEESVCGPPHTPGGTVVGDTPVLQMRRLLLRASIDGSLLHLDFAEFLRLQVGSLLCSLTSRFGSTGGFSGPSQLEELVSALDRLDRDQRHHERALRDGCGVSSSNGGGGVDLHDVGILDSKTIFSSSPHDTASLTRISCTSFFPRISLS